MNRRHILSLSAITALGLALLPGNAVAQTKSLKEQIVGSWTYVSADRGPRWQKDPDVWPQPIRPDDIR
jgi:hypothetical protein